jgi:hypothetical protein
MPLRALSLLAALVLLIICATPTLHAENWPAWRGPRGDGTSHEKDIPVKWSGQTGDNIAWKVAVPGKGHASPIVWEDRVFLVSSKGDDRLLICLDRATGKTLWQRIVLTAPPEKTHRLNSYASSTPCTDGQRVYVSFQAGKDMYIAGWDFDGKQVWQARPGAFYSQDGYCASPILHNDKLIINGDQDGPCYLVALDKRTGKTIWKTDRPNARRSYCTPIIRTIPKPLPPPPARPRNNPRTQMLLSGAHTVASYDPDTGKQHWVVQGPTLQYVGSLVFNGEQLFVSAGFPEFHMLAIDPTGSGDVTDSHVLWHHPKNRFSAYVPSPVAAGPYFVVASDHGVASCLEAKTGRVVWREKLDRHVSASLVAVGDVVHVTADYGLAFEELGVTTVIRVGPKFEVVSRNVLGEPVSASPAISGGQLFIRGEEHLFCIGKR